MSLTKVTYSMTQGAPINVDDLGGDPTGVADSYAALTAALATGKLVLLTSGGTYKSSGTLNFNGGKQLFGQGYGAGIIYTGSGVSLLMTNGGNIIENVALTTTAAATKGLHLFGASSNLVRNFSVTGNPANGVFLESTDTSAQTDWNNFENVTVNTAVLPVALVASGTGAVNSNVFRGVSNWRTSAVAGGATLYLNGGGAGVIGNSFYDIDLSGYTNNNSVIIDGPGTSQTNFIGISVDTGSLTGCILGSGVSSTKWIGGTNQANTPFVRNNLATAGTDTLLTSSINFNGSQQFANLGTASSGVVGNKNLLWYEEGTFVPTVSGSTSGTPTGYGTAVGTYTRVGNRVNFDLYVSLTGVGTMVGNIQIGGLPFTAAVISGSQGCVSIGYANNFGAGVTSQILGAINPGTKDIALYQFAAGNSTAITVANAAAMVVLLSGSYQV